MFNDLFDPVNTNYEAVVERFIGSTLQVDDIRTVVKKLRATDWYTLVKARDEDRAERERKYLHELVNCDKCGSKTKRLHLGRLEYGPPPYGSYCAGCAKLIDAEFRAPCLVCGTVCVSPKRGMKNVLCDSCKTANNERFVYFEKLRVSQQNARAQTLGCSNDLTLHQWLKTIDAFGNRCAYCGGSWNALDHVIPISNGGGTTVSNCVPACSVCNGAKGCKPLHEVSLPNKDNVLGILSNLLR